MRPSAKKLEAFRLAVVKAIPSLSEIQSGALTKVAGSVFANRSRLTFSEKYRHAVAETDRDVLRIFICLSNADFSLIKRIRYKIAHGDDP